MECMECFYTIATIFIPIKSSVNFLLYCFISQKFRKTLIRIFCKAISKKSTLNQLKTNKECASLFSEIISSTIMCLKIHFHVNRGKWNESNAKENKILGNVLITNVSTTSTTTIEITIIQTSTPMSSSTTSTTNINKTTMKSSTESTTKSTIPSTKIDSSSTTITKRQYRVNLFITRIHIIISKGCLKL